MAYRCPNSNIVGTTMLNGYELQFKGVATIEENKNAQTPVLIWLIPPEDEKTLDIYEGYPNLYRKENVEIQIGDEVHQSMVYIMNGNNPLSVPSEAYYNCIEQGYLDNGLDIEYLEQALEEAIIEKELEQTDDHQMSL